MTNSHKWKGEEKRSPLQHRIRTFYQKGINATAISDIVEKAGVAKGTFYLYFKEKYDIKNKLTAFKTHELFEKAAKALRKGNVQVNFLLKGRKSECISNVWL